MIVFDWINSLNNWQQAIIGIPWAIVIAHLILIIFKEIKIIKVEN